MPNWPPDNILSFNDIVFEGNVEAFLSYDVPDHKLDYCLALVLFADSRDEQYQVVAESESGHHRDDLFGLLIMRGAIVDDAAELYYRTFSEENLVEVLRRRRIGFRFLDVAEEI